MKVVSGIGACLITVCAPALAQQTVTIPAPEQKIDASATVIYCDAILGTRLRAVESEDAKGASSLSASVEKPGDRLIIEIDGKSLYVHFREDFESGKLFYAQMWPLTIVEGATGQQGILAYGVGRAPKSATISAISLNRSSGVGMWTLTKDAVSAREGKNYPDSTAMYLTCGARKK